MTVWARFNRVGVAYHPANDPDKARNTMLANRISLFTFLLGILLFTCYVSLFPWNPVTGSILAVGILSLVTILLNALGKTDMSRVWLCFLIPVSALVVSVVSKKVMDPVPASDYFDFRFIILASSVFPFILFSFSEKKLLLSALSAGVVVLLVYDALHNVFDVGYYQTGLQDRSYYFTNVVILIAYAGSHMTIFFLKQASEKSEKDNIKLISDLHAAKKNLEERNEEIALQNREIRAQSEVLNQSQQQLSHAYNLIGRQKELLSRENKQLEDELLRKNKDLTRANEELVKHNTELRQFSFAVSHNLRGPIASLLGLISLIDETSLDEKNLEIMQHIRSSSTQLDTIIKDLGKIIDIRHDIFRIRQRISLKDEIGAIRHLFRDKMEASHASIREELQTTELYSVKPMVHSILYNLISNSIKYRSPERPLDILVSATENFEYYIIKVTDNGLGIDLKQHSKDLFRLYKRFHAHTEGRGLGLYLVKLQCETLGGTIDLTSEPNKYTTFTVYLKKPENVNKQVLYSEKHAKIFYDAELNLTGVIWHGPVPAPEYRKVFNKCIDLLKVYNTCNWIANITNLGPVDETEEQWLMDEIIPVAAKNGLKRIGIVASGEPEAPTAGYIGRTQHAFERSGVRQQVFTDLDDVSDWIRRENEKSVTFKSAIE